MQSQSNNIVSRIARWSGEHRKTAILGWLVLVFALVGLLGNKVIETNRLTAAEEVAGEAGEAERTLDAAGLSPTAEIALLQSSTETTDDPGFRALIAETERTLADTPHVERVRSPLDGSGGGISDDRHSAFVDFEVKGGRKNVDANLDSSLDAVADLQAVHPDYVVEQFGGGSAGKTLNETFQADLGKAGQISLPLTLLILADRARSVGRGQRAARARAYVRTGDDGDRRNPEPGVSSQRQYRRPDLADRARRRRRLLALLYAPSAGGAGGRAREPRGDRNRGGYLGPRGDDLRAHGHDRDGGDVHHRRRDLRFVRGRHGQRRPRRDVRDPGGAPRGARVARRPDREGPDPVYPA